MKISFLEPHLKIFGGIRRIMELSNRLVGLGHDVTIFHSDGSPCTWIEGLAATEPIEAVLGSEHDVLIYNNPSPLEYRLAQQTRARLKAYYVLGLYETPLLAGFKPSLYLRRNLTTRYVKRCLFSAGLKLTNATWMRDWLRRKMRIESILLLGGVNREMFHPVDVPNDPTTVRVLCSGDPRGIKGTKAIREAVRIAQRTDPRIRLETYHGKGIPQHEMAATYSSADIFVEASCQAGWNNPVAEAMACGVPVVCTDIGGVRDFAAHERTALLVPVGRPQEMAEAILRLASRPRLRETLAENAQRWIASFDWDRTAANLEQILIEELSKQHARV